MASWTNDAAEHNPNGNGFSHINDANAAGGVGIDMMDPSGFMAASTQFNSNQFASPQQQQQHQQQQQQMLAIQHNMINMQNVPNGEINASQSAFQNPMYQTNSVIPSKRPRPREDSMAGSPPQNPGLLPATRAETPQQAQYSTFPPAAHSQKQQSTPQASYPHMPPNGSANATPSPNMGNQIRSGSAPQRVSTASPHPFSPATQSFAPQASPVPSDPSPLSQPQTAFVQPNNFGSVFNPNNFTPTLSSARPSPSSTQVPGQLMPQHTNQMPQQMGQMSPMGLMGQMNQMPQMGQVPQSQMFNSHMQQQLAQGRTPMEQQKLMYQMQLQRQLQQGNIQGTSQLSSNNASQQRNMLTRQQQQQQQHTAGANGQVPPGTPGAAKVNIHAPNIQRFPPDQFVQQLSLFMSRQKLPLDINPVAGDRPVHLKMLFQAVQKMNGSGHIMRTNGWPQVAQALGYPPAQIPIVSTQIKMIYERNLLKFEEFLAQNRAKSSQSQQQQSQQTNTQLQAQHTPQTPQMQRTSQLPQQQEVAGPSLTPSTPRSTTQLPPGQPSQPGEKLITINGQQRHGFNGLYTSQPSNSTRTSIKNITSKDSLTGQPLGQPGRMGAVATSKSAHLNGAAHSEIDEAGGVSVAGGDPDQYKPCSRESYSFGGVNVDAPARVVTDIVGFRPDVPTPPEMGNIDIHALTKSIQSGIKGEVRLALDILAAVSVSHIPGLDIELEKCDDLLDTIIDYAYETVEILAENTVEVSDEILIPAYEDICRACQIERLSLRDEPEVGSGDEEAKKAVDYLLCVTTVLRNLSFNPRNQVVLADETTVRFLCQTIRYAGTRNMFLRTQLSMLDFMKDVIVLLSNIAGCIEVPDSEAAFCFLQFLLAFAPTPSPSISDEDILFPPFQPSLHPYLPPAVDALAKLLARDVPNRTHFRNVFSADANEMTSTDLLTRAFSLAISPFPVHVRESRPRHLPPVVEARKPVLMQGLLAADIIASLTPGCESGIARAWLAANTSFAQNLYRSVRDLCRQFESVEIHARQYRLREPPRKDAELMYIVVLAISLLRKLSEKVIEPSDPSAPRLLASILPPEDGLLEGLEMISGEWSREGFLHNLVAFASLGD